MKGPVSDEAFDQHVAQLWLNKTWSMVGTSAALVVVSILFNPFGVFGLIAFTAGLGALLRGLKPPGVIRHVLGGRNLLPGGVAVLCQLLALVTTVPVLISQLFIKARPPMLFELLWGALF